MWRMLASKAFYRALVIAGVSEGVAVACYSTLQPGWPSKLLHTQATI